MKLLKQNNKKTNNKESNILKKSNVEVPISFFNDNYDYHISNSTNILEIPLGYLYSSNLDNSPNSNIINRSILLTEVSTLIIQTAFAKICSVIDQSYFRRMGYDKFINLKVSIKEKFDTEDYAKLFESILINIILKTERYKYNPAKYINTATTQITSIILNDICLGIDKEINDILFRVLFIPDINKVYNIIMEDPVFITLYSSCTPVDESNIATYGAMYLKSQLYHDICNFSITLQMSIEEILLHFLT